jgi:two-component sensor histidine kinase
MWRVARILRWRWRQPPLIRWLEAMALFGVAFTIRFWLGALLGVTPFVSFYPAILLAAVLLGWKEASVVLMLSLCAGWYFFLPAKMPLLVAGWALAATVNIAIIVSLKALAKELDEANERQRLLFQELQHRIANTQQMTIGRLEMIKRRMSDRPAEAEAMLDETIVRMATSADIHRRLHDPALFSQGLESMFGSVLATVIDQGSVKLDLDVEELDLSLDRKSIIAMLVIEVANNAVKHVFQPGRGTSLQVTLRALPSKRAVLKIRDNGPGALAASPAAASGQQLGMRILNGLAGQIQGTLRIESGDGTEVVVEFPTGV